MKLSKRIRAYWSAIKEEHKLLKQPPFIAANLAMDNFIKRLKNDENVRICIEKGVTLVIKRNEVIFKLQEKQDDPSI